MEYLGLYNYWVFIVLVMLGLYTVMSRVNLIKKLIGMSIFQSAVFLLYITMDKVEGGTAPILTAGAEEQLYSNPLPQVLILTAIVVGIATLALGLALVVRIGALYETIEEDEIREMEPE